MLFKATMFMPDANANLYMMQLSQQTTQTRANDANKYGLTGEFAPHLTKSQRKAVLKWRRDMPKRMEYWKLLEIFKQRMEREKKNLQEYQTAQDEGQYWDREMFHTDMADLIKEVADLWCKVDLMDLEATEYLRWVT